MIHGLIGIGLFLIYAHEQMNHPKALEVATKIGYHLIKSAVVSLAGWGMMIFILSLILFSNDIERRNELGDRRFR